MIFAVKVTIFRKTRIAPTPSGYLHAGNALSFLLTSALARRYGAGILLRIDDIDQERARAAYIDDIFETLRFLGISWDEGPRDAAEYRQTWSQRHRLPLYDEALKQLAVEGLIFACVCSRAALLQNAGVCGCRSRSLPLSTPEAAWRLDTIGERTLSLRTLSGTIRTELPRGMQNFIVRRKNGSPSYQLASAIDDLHFGIDLVVRGEDLWPSTLAQLYLAEVLGANKFREITFYHHALLRDHGGNKLSKSEGALSVRHYREQGKSREDVLDLVRRLGGDELLSAAVT